METWGGSILRNDPLRQSAAPPLLAQRKTTVTKRDGPPPHRLPRLGLRTCPGFDGEALTLAFKSLINPAAHMTKLISRRRLLASAVLAAGSGCLCHAFGGQPFSTCCNTPDLEPESWTLAEHRLTIDLAKAHTLSRAQSAAYVVAREGELQLVIVRSGRKSYHALSRLCTHGRQVLSYVPQRRRLMCNSFNHSQFYLDGTIAKGPAESPIRAYPCVLKGGTLEVSI